jgi:hypothetical protein
VKNVAIVGAGTTPGRSPLVEKALRELAQMPLTEACVSGLCDICLYQAGLCNMVGKHWADAQPSKRSGE